MGGSKWEVVSIWAYLADSNTLSLTVSLKVNNYHHSPNFLGCRLLDLQVLIRGFYYIQI